MFYYSTIIIGVIALVILLWIKSKLPQIFGRMGENFVARKLRTLDPTHYRVLNDVMLPSQGNMDTTQIDHVVVSNYGIFCIETKSYAGWIFGNAYDQYWTQVLYRKKFRFFNPIRQNYGHMKALEALIRQTYPDAPILSFIAFPHADKLKISGTDTVGHARDVLEKIMSFRNPVISDADRDKIYEIPHSTGFSGRAYDRSPNAS